jgi:hypothetical protein
MDLDNLDVGAADGMQIKGPIRKQYAAVARVGSAKPGGAADENSAGTPRPDGPQPTEQQINEGPYTGRHTGGWKMKRALLAPADERDHGRHISMSNVHGTFFEEPKQRWFETHNNTRDTPAAADFKTRLYPLDRKQYSPWEPTVEDMTPISKTIGSYATKKGPTKAAIQPAPKPASKGVAKKGEMQPQAAITSVSDNPSWGKVREGQESPVKPDPSWGYTGHYASHRFDAGEENLSMASRINKRRQQSIERRFSASPYASQLAQDVVALSDGVEYKGPAEYGWRTFPPQGL